jgi:hypothetical protein
VFAAGTHNRGVDFSSFDRLTNPVIRPASGNVRFVFKPLGVVAGLVFVAFVVTVTPWLIAVAALPEPWRTLLFLIGLPLVLLAMHRALRVSVVADDAGLTVKNYWRTYVLPWGDVTEVRGAMLPVGASAAPVIAFRTIGGKLVKAEATITMDKRKRVFVRELKACPELDEVPFNLPPKLLP